MLQLLATLAAADASLQLTAPLYAALCLAENAIGPASYRPDDIIAMHSGLTVEVVDTDAEGRFVVGLATGAEVVATRPCVFSIENHKRNIQGGA